MSTQEPFYAAIAVNGACRRRPTILKLITNSNETPSNSYTKNTQKQSNHNSKPLEA
jgi:hypothetical protein